MINYGCFKRLDVAFTDVNRYAVHRSGEVVVSTNRRFPWDELDSVSELRC